MTSEREDATVAEARTRSWSMAEALAVHVQEGADGASELGLSGEERAELESLARVAHRLDARMRPLHPSPPFVRSLGEELVREAGRRIVRREKRRRIAVISAAVAGGLVSIASLVGGIVVLVKWLRTRSEARQASAA
jgi:hypothetical protein